MMGATMRILFTTRGSSGHVGPLVPFVRACRDAGHEVLVAAQAQHAANVERAGVPFSPVGDPPAEEWQPLLGSFATLPLDEADAMMIGPFFAGLDTRAALDDLRALVEDWRPSLMVRESWEFASTLVASERGVPLARVALALAAMEETTARLAAATVDELRIAGGLPADPGGRRLRESACLTLVPEALEDPAVPAPRAVHRFRPPAPEPAPPLPDWWPGRTGPLVYVSFGSVAADSHLPFYPALYRAAIEALAELPVRVLVTTGSPREIAALGPPASNVRVESWVAQDAVLPFADVVVGHGGFGTTLGALAHGVPIVGVPLFSGDQHVNAAAVARAGAGIALNGDRATRRVFDLPAPEVLAGLGPAVARVLGDGAYRRAAGELAAAMQAQPPVEAAADVLAALARS
jgi:UDP:flavonoid glycosyltransferase YjiC (YdhE family)